MRTRIALLAALAACKGNPDPTPWCSAAPEQIPEAPSVTYHKDVYPILESKCTRCHEPGGLAPFSLKGYQDAFTAQRGIAEAVRSRVMPPWLAARCCTDYLHDFSLTSGEIATLVKWADTRGPEGNPADAPREVPRVGGLSRVDVTLKMPVGYTPQPKPGTTDDTRCFVLDWPETRERFVTGLNPVPGVRTIVHHLVVAEIPKDELKQLDGLEGKDGRPGFDCNGQLGNLRGARVLGGSLLGSDYPEGLGTKISPGSKVVLNIHYSTAHGAPAPDQTAVQFRLDDAGRDVKAIPIANPAWLAGDVMKIKAGEKDAVYWYRYQPTLLTRGKPVRLRSVTPHMHYFASKMTVRIIHKDDRRECLLEIPRWDFGWEQPFWFKEPKLLVDGDELYLECHFDNSAENQKNGQPPRDIAWGGDNQDMCAAFVGYTEGDQ